MLLLKHAHQTKLHLESLQRGVVSSDKRAFHEVRWSRWDLLLVLCPVVCPFSGGSDHMWHADPSDSVCCVSVLVQADRTVRGHCERGERVHQSAFAN